MTSKNKKSAAATPITLIKHSEWKAWFERQKPATKEWLKANRFSDKPGSFCVLPGEVFVTCLDKPDLWTLAALPDALPEGEYRLEAKLDAKTANAMLYGWILGSYKFSRYKKPSRKPAVLLPPAGSNADCVKEMAGSILLARDLINTPANDMGPAELAAACKQVAKDYKASYSEIVGEDLLKHNYPAIYEVGKASSRAPRLVDIRWGDARHPKVTLVGKGVCFDSGGLDIKSSAGMKLMKKDMGGAAAVLALARMIMIMELPVRLRVLIPAVENSISGNAYRPCDVIKTRKGMSVEIGNTDAEGRIILCDALYEADQEKPDLLIDCATLTGAARTALGTDIPALFTPDDALANDLLQKSVEHRDPMWRLPLWAGYRDMLNSDIADINSAPDSGYAGAITAALYLREFVEKTTAWAHVDMMAWNLSKRPGRPQGGEAMAIRAMFGLIAERFGKPSKKLD